MTKTTDAQQIAAMSRLGLETVSIEITGLSPMLLHNGQLANPLNPYAKRLGELHKEKKRKGVDKDKILAEIADVEWEGGLYWSDEFGPIIEGSAIHTAIVNGARQTRCGRDIERYVQVLPHETPLIYSGPRDLEGLRADPQFMDQRMVKIGQVKVLRSRPRFFPWSLGFTAAFSSEGIHQDDLLRHIEATGRFEGLMDGRKKGFGRFQITKIDGKGIGS